MRDSNISQLARIANALRSPIWNLHCQNREYGTGYDISRTGEKQITLDLMNGDAKNGLVIDRIVLDFDVEVVNAGLTDVGWVENVVSLFEEQLFEKQDTRNRTTV